jgi:SAM-dependent methyltransferase
MSLNPDESPEFWADRGEADLRGIVAELHRQRRQVAEAQGFLEVQATRRAISHTFLRGTGVEVGAGNRPWPIPDHVTCCYGDIRDHGALQRHFKDEGVTGGEFVDAQTFVGIESEVFDFVLSAHVIEHLPDPIGAIRSALRVIKPGGVVLLSVPDMRYTTDRLRPVTSLDHLRRDAEDGGLGTQRQAYEEHVRFVHPLQREPIPEEEIDFHIDRLIAAKMDIHWHAWTAETFAGLLGETRWSLGFRVAAQVPVQNENIFALLKSAPET